MPYGAHETMEVHEILLQKINCINHFNIYAKETNNPQLKDMLVRHQQEEVRSYDEILAYTNQYNEFSPVPSNTDIRGVNPDQIQYGLNNVPQYTPESNATLNDQEVAIAMLLCHKNGARNATWASLECADPNLRRLLLNSAATCVNQAYEVFLFMNEQGMYPVPKLDTRTAETFLGSYQPSDQDLQNQYFQQAGQGGQGIGDGGQGMGYGGQNGGYGGQNTGYGGQNAGYGWQNTGYGGQNAGYGGQNAGYGGQNAGYGWQNMGYGGQNANRGSSGSLYTGSPDSILYGEI